MVLGDLQPPLPRRSTNPATPSLTIEHKLHLAGREFCVVNATLPADGKGHDSHYIGSIVAVADGATPANPADGESVRRYGADFLWYLAAAHGRQPDIETVALFRSAITQAEAGIRPGGARPTAVAALIRPARDQLLIEVLGDCTVLALTVRGDVLTIHDGSTDRFQTLTMTALQAKLAQTGDRDTAWRAAADQMKANKESQNRPGGFWVIGGDPDAADHVTCERVPTGQLAGAIVCSDGFARAWSLTSTSPEYGMNALSQASGQRSLAPHAGPIMDPEKLLHGLMQARSPEERDVLLKTVIAQIRAREMALGVPPDDITAVVLIPALRTAIG